MTHKRRSHLTRHRLKPLKVREVRQHLIRRPRLPAPRRFLRLTLRVGIQEPGEEHLPEVRVQLRSAVVPAGFDARNVLVVVLHLGVGQLP